MTDSVTKEVEAIIETHEGRVKVVYEDEDYECYAASGVPCVFMLNGRCGGFLEETGDCRGEFRKDGRSVVFVKEDANLLTN